MEIFYAYGLALAAAAVFSLSACGEDKPAETTPGTSDTGDNGTTPDGGGTVTQKYTVTYHTTHGTAPAAVADVTALPATLPTLTDDEYDFVGWAATENGTEIVTAGATITKNTDLYAVWLSKARFTVTYHTAHGEAPEALANVKALPETLPTLTDEEFNFVGWAATENGTEAVTAGTAITANADLYAIWTEKTAYEKVATSQYTEVAYDFTDSSLAFGDYSSYSCTDKGIFSMSEQTESLKVEVADGKLSITDSDTAKSTEGMIAFGPQFEGVVEGTMKYTPGNSDNSLNGGWSMVQFRGYTSFVKEPSVLFALRTNNDKKIQVVFTSECTKDTNDKTVYVFHGTEFTYEANKEYQIDWKYDFTSKKLTIKINGTVVVENLDVPAGDQPVFLTGVSFVTAGSDVKRSAKVDEFAIKTTNRGTLEETKAYFTGLLDALAATYDVTNNYKFSAELIPNTLTDEKADIAALDSKEDIINSFLSTDLTSILNDTQLKNLYVKILSDAKAGLANYYVYNKTAFDALFDGKIAAINNATTLAAFNTAVEDSDYTTELEAIKSDATVRGEKLLAYTTYFQTISNSIIALQLDINAYANAVSEINAVSAKYISTDETATTTLSYCAITDIDTILDAAKGELDAVYSKYSLSIEDLTAEYNADLGTKKAAAKEKFDSNTFDGYVDDVTDLVATDYETKEALEEAYEAKLERLEFLDAWYDSVISAIDEYRQYAYVKRGTVLDQNAVHFGTLVNSLNNYFKTCLTDLLAIDFNADDYDDQLAEFVADVKEEVDNIIAAYRAETEVVVTFYKLPNDEAPECVSIVKGETVSAPETDPTLDGYAFKGWYTNSSYNTPFDFTANISANTSVYACWYDLYSTTQNVNINTSFKDLKFNDDTVANFKNGVKTIIAKDSNNEDFVYTVSSDASNGVSIDSSNGFKFKNTGAYISFELSGTATIVITLKIGSDGRGIIIKNGTTKYCSIYSGGTDNTDATFTYGTDTNGIDIQKKKNDTRKITLVNVPAGTYYISTYASQDTYIKSININEEATVTKVIGSIDATVTAGTDSINISDVKLYDNATTPNVIATLTTGQYTVEVRDSNNEVVTDYSSGLAAGQYRVRIIYPDFTRCVKTVVIE